MPGLTDEQLDDLTDAEREAIEADYDEGDEELEEEEADEDEGSDDEGDEAGDDEGDDTADDDAPAEEPAAKPAEEAAEPPIEHDPDEPETLEVGDLDALKAEEATLRAELDKLKKEFRSGDLDVDLDEYEEKRDELQAKLAKLNTRAEIYENNARINEGRWQAFKDKVWKETQATAKEDGVDYSDQKLAGQFDKALRFLGSDPDNGGKSLRWFFQEAHAMVAARFGAKPSRGAEQITVKAKPGVKDAVSARSRNLPKAPPSLGKLPEAGAEAIGQDEFSHLDNLSGLQLERAIAKMSKEQRERYEMVG